MGDRKFEVHRYYEEEEDWLAVGRVTDCKMSTVGNRFGAGKYRIYEVDRATDEKTDRQPVVRNVHPGMYRYNPKYAKPPREIEHDELKNFGAGDEDPGELRGLSTKELYERAVEKVRAEFLARQKQDELDRALKDLKAELENLKNLGATRTPTDRLAEIREIMGFVKELQPPPVLTPPTLGSPVDAFRQSVETIKMLQGLQGELSNMPGFAPASKGNPALEKLTESLTGLASKAIENFGKPRLPLAPAPAMGSGAAGSAVATAAAPATQANAEELSAMFQELLTRLQQDQADQLGASPKTHISETCAWVRGKWSNTTATPAWKNLKTMVMAYDESMIAEYLKKEAPALAVTDQQKGWILSLLETLKRPGN